MTKAEILYEKLKKYIIECNPGASFLSSRAIMNDYQVSLATVTAAVRRLVAEGLLQPNARRNMLITDEILKYRKNAPLAVCLALPHWQSDWYTFVEHCFFDLAPELGYELEILHFDWQASVPKELQKLRRKLDAIVLLSDVEKLSPELFRKMDEHGLPYVFFGRDIANLPVNCVVLDNEYSGAQAAHHLIELGHKKLAVVMSQPKSEGVCLKCKGFQQYSELHGIPVEVIDCGISSGDFAPARVYEELKKRYSNGSPEFTGLFTLCEDSVPAVYRFCCEKGIQIPRDLSVVAIGESWRLDYYTPPVTAVARNVRTMVREIIRIIKNNLAAAAPIECERVLVRPGFVIRKSTASGSRENNMEGERKSCGGK